MMTVCNKRPPPNHPFADTGVACHIGENHEGPCTWATEPSLARKGIDLLLATFSHREIETIDSQPVREVYVWAPRPPEPWVLVRFVGGDEFAVWKRTGAVYRVFAGAVEDDPILVPEGAPEGTPRPLHEQRNAQA